MIRIGNAKYTRDGQGVVIVVALADDPVTTQHEIPMTNPTDAERVDVLITARVIAAVHGCRLLRPRWVASGFRYAARECRSGEEVRRYVHPIILAYLANAQSSNPLDPFDPLEVLHHAFAETPTDRITPASVVASPR